MNKSLVRDSLFPRNTENMSLMVVSRAAARGKLHKHPVSAQYIYLII